MENQDYHAEVTSFKHNGYVVFKKHLDVSNCEVLTKVAMQTLFDIAFFQELAPPEPTFENLKFFTSDEARKTLRAPNGIWIGGRADRPLCSRVTGLCYGSYLPEVQSRFTMTVSTFEKLSALYGSNHIAQIYGPKKYSIRLKDGFESQIMMDCNLMSDFHNVCCEEKIMASLIVNVDESVPAAESGTICLIPRFNLYRKHARKFFNFVMGEKRLPLDLSSPMLFPPELMAEGLPAFNTMLKELHAIRDKGMKPTSRHQGYLKFPLPPTFTPLAWEFVKVEKGDLLCRSQWLPYYETACKSSIPLIAFHVGYYPIPEDFLGSYKQRRLVDALENGHTMTECKEWEEVKNNSMETYMRKCKNDTSTYFYVPNDDDDIEFAMFIQCLDVEMLRNVS